MALETKSESNTVPQRKKAKTNNFVREMAALKKRADRFEGLRSEVCQRYVDATGLLWPASRLSQMLAGRAPNSKLLALTLEVLAEREAAAEKSAA